jgi:hypothetical protein
VYEVAVLVFPSAPLAQRVIGRLKTSGPVSRHETSNSDRLLTRLTRPAVVIDLCQER